MGPPPAASRSRSSVSAAPEASPYLRLITWNVARRRSRIVEQAAALAAPCPGCRRAARGDAANGSFVEDRLRADRARACSGVPGSRCLRCACSRTGSSARRGTSLLELEGGGIRGEVRPPRTVLVDGDDMRRRNLGRTRLGADESELAICSAVRGGCGPRGCQRDLAGHLPVRPVATSAMARAERL